MSDHTPDTPADDDTYDDDYVHDDGCWDCIEPTPPSRKAIIVTVLLAALFTAFAWLAVGGDATLGNGWGVMLGFAVLGGSLLMSLWPGILTITTGMLAVALWGSETFQDAFSTGTAFLITVGAVLFVAASIGTWHDAGYGSPFTRHRDPVADEAAAGLEDAEKYLQHSAEHMSAHTISLMDPAARKMIGLSGYAGAGKDTAAAGLIYDLDYTRVSFADKLREFAYALNPLVVVTPTDILYLSEASPSVFETTERPAYRRLVDLVDTYGWERAKYEVADVRALLQRIGTDAGRDVLGENVWVDAVMADLPDGPVVFTDTRFENEARAIRDAGGYVVRVSRPGVSAVNAHVSETALDEYDFDGAIINEGTMAETRQQMIEVEQVLYGKH